MPKEYEECKKSEIRRGRPENVAQRICAIMFYKRHKMTPRQWDEQHKEESSASYSYNKSEEHLFNVIELLGPLFNKKKENTEEKGI